MRLYPDVCVKRSKSGFLLIEWMIHFLLSSMLLLVAATLVMSWHKNVISIGRLCDNALSVYLAGDALRNDIHNACVVTADAKGVRIESPQAVFFWQYYDSALWRQIVYQPGSSNKSSKSLFAQHISNSDFVVKVLSKTSQAVRVNWQVQDKRFLFVSRNGLLL